MSVLRRECLLRRMLLHKDARYAGVTRSGYRADFKSDVLSAGLPRLITTGAACLPIGESYT